MRLEKIKAAISVSSAAHYLDNERLQSLTKDVRRIAELISRELEWEGQLASVRKTVPKTAQAATPPFLSVFPSPCWWFFRLRRHQI